jgi:predicted urease superfamily metal-dependent hydrolase
MCGNGHLACVNPLHIRPGTPRQNAHDRFIHAPRGKKLTTEEVETIRSAWAAGGITQGELGHRYGVHPATISRIVRGHLWTPEEAWR